MLRTRVLTAIVMALLLYLATAYLSSFYFGLLLAVVLAPALREWTGLMTLRNTVDRVIYAASVYALLLLLAWGIGVSPEATSLNRTGVLAIMLVGVLFWLFASYAILSFPQAQALWSSRPRIGLMGFFYIVPLWVALVQLKYMAVSGYLVLALIALVSIVDIGAYFAGRAFGKRKMAPALSPKKTWAGFCGGLASCALLTALLLVLVHLYVQPLASAMFIILLMASLLVAVAGVAGDLYESMLKRNCGLKDSGSSLPGHGGLLDRADSLVAAAPVFVLAVMFLLPNASWH